MRTAPAVLDGFYFVFVEGALQFARVEQTKRVGSVFEGHHAGDVFDHAAFFDDVAVRVGDVYTDRFTKRDDSVYLTGWAEVLCDGVWLVGR